MLKDCANNTLDMDKVTTIASDTTQIRANTPRIEDINDSHGSIILSNTLVTEDSGKALSANFDTDLEDYLQKAVSNYPGRSYRIYRYYSY